VCLHTAGRVEVDHPFRHCQLLKLLLSWIILKELFPTVAGTEGEPEVLETFWLFRLMRLKGRNMTCMIVVYFS